MAGSRELNESRAEQFAAAADVLGPAGVRRVLAALALAFLAGARVSADDQQLTQQIAGRLRAHKAEGQLEQFDIRLNIQNGAVYMYGYVATPQQKQLALNVARQTSGVRQVFNQLQVRPRRNTVRTLIAEIQNAGDSLPAAPLPGGLDTLLRPAEAAAAGSWPELHSEPAGQLVQNPQPHGPAVSQISSRRAGPASDARQIADRLIEGFQQDQNRGKLRESRIELSVKQGVVRMRGRVTSHEQRQLALQLAEQVVGVGRVINELQVPDSNRQPVSAASGPEPGRLPPINVTIRLPQTEWE